MGAFRRLRDLPPEERQKFLTSADIEKRFTPEERDLLVRLEHLLPRQPGRPPAETPPPPEQ
jgi:hypothetical protein